MKVTGAEIAAYFEEWPLGDDWYHEDGEIELFADTETNEFLLDRDKKYDVSQIGYLAYQGQDPALKHEYGLYGRSFEAELKRWRKARDTAVVVVSLPKRDLEEFRALCKERKWKAE